MKSEIVDLIIESGTYRGDTTKFLATAFPDKKIITVEANPRFAAYSRRELRHHSNVEVVEGDSGTVLATSRFAMTLANCNVFAYLDAHWNERVPLQDELTVLARNARAFVALIDDCKVPGLDFHYDSYPSSGDLDEEFLRSIAPSDSVLYWPLSSYETGARRGTAYICSKEFQTILDSDSGLQAAAAR